MERTGTVSLRQRVESPQKDDPEQPPDFWDRNSFLTVLEPEAVKIGSRPQLFFDDYVVEDTALLVRTLHPVRKFGGNPVLREEHPWERMLDDTGAPGLNLYGSVLFDPERKLFRMWYLTKPNAYHACYAESEDGIAWKKPLLDLVAFGEHRRTNIVLAPGLTYKGRVVVAERGAQPLTVMRDENDTPERRFKGMFTTGARKIVRGMMACYSRDGLHWEFAEQNPVLPGWSDTSNTLFWDPIHKKYTLMMRPVTYCGVKRRTAISVSSDFIHWSFPRIVMRCDERDNAEPDFPGFTSQHVDFPRQVYGMPAFFYEGLYVGLKQLRDGNIIRLELAHSRDAVNWHNDPLRREFVPLGPQGSWDSAMNQAAPPVQVGTELRFYYGGKDYEHTEAARKKGHGSIGFGTLRHHGFYSLASGNHTGQLLTRPLLCEGATLSLNAGVRGSLRVALEDAFGHSIKGFSSADCGPVSGDSLQHKVRWKDNESLSRLRGKSIRLRIEIDRGEIYSFHIS